MKNLERRHELSAQMTAIVIKLESMDYMTSKYVDGDYTKEQWVEIVKKRTELRRQYNEAEKELEKIKDKAEQEEQEILRQ